MYEIDVVPVYISPMPVACGSSKIASYSSKISESLLVALVPLVHKITFSEEFMSSLANGIPFGHGDILDV